MVRQCVDWYKKYRDILESDLIHGRRADGRHLDWMLHVNPNLERKGMLCVYNPTAQPISETLQVDLYYTGLKENATIQRMEAKPKTLQIGPDNKIELEVTVPAGEMVWFVLK